MNLFKNMALGPSVCVWGWVGGRIKAWTVFNRYTYIRSFKQNSGERSRATLPSCILLFTLNKTLISSQFSGIILCKDLYIDIGHCVVI